MAVHYRTQGIFLKKSFKGEADELFVVYTKNFGKLDILGKAIRKITSKLRGGAATFYLSEIEFIQGKTHKILTDAVLLDNFQNIGRDLEKLEIIRQITNALDSLTPKEERDSKIWQLLSEVFEKLNNPYFKIKSPKLIYYYFFWNLVSIIGYQPEVSGCSIQGRAVNCDIIRILKVILKKDWRILARLKIETAHQELLKNSCEWYNNTIIK